MNEIPSSAATLPTSLPPELASHPDYQIVRELGRGGIMVRSKARKWKACVI
jgi:hypothetical protein